MWDGTKWNPVGGNVLHGGLGGISCFVIYQGELWIAGLFNQIYGNPYNGIARWNRSGWLDPGEEQVHLPPTYLTSRFIMMNFMLPGVLQA